MKRNKKILLPILSLAAVSLGCVAVGNLSFREAMAETTLNTLDTFRVEKVSVRLAVEETEENGGFRFESLISEEVYGTLENVTEVGTLFVPAGYNVADASIALDDNGNVLHQKVQKVVLQGGVDNRAGGRKTTDDNNVAVISYRAYVNNIPNTAYAAEITARSYVVANGVTYYTETVNESVGGVATEAYYDVVSEADEVYCNEVASGWYSPFTVAQRTEIGEYVKTSNKTYADKYVVVANGNATLDLTKLSINAKDVVGAMVDGKFVEWSVNGSTLTYATTVGEKTLTIATKKGVYNVALVQADQVITNYTQFSTWTNTAATFATYKYTVLANDITASGTNWINAGKLPDGYVFNGLGHTIDGFTSGKGIVDNLGGANAVWKNVNYTNYNGTTVLYVANGTFENVNITGTVGLYNNDNLLAYTINSGSTLIKNCVFNLNHKTAGTTLALATKGSTYNNLTLVDTTIIYGNGQLTTTDLDLSKGSNYYLYDIDDVNTNYYAKVSSGTATFPLSQMGTNAPTTVSKLLVNGVEKQATVANGNLTYPASNTGSTALMMTTDKGVRVMNIVHADNVLTSWSEFNAWIQSTTEYNKYNYTVLARDITASGTIYTNGGQFQKTFDGLGHTIDKFTCGHGIVQRLLSGATWKNVNYTNLTTTGQGLFGYLAGGTYENINISGTLANNETYILAYGISTATTIKNCTFNLTNANNMEKCLCGGSVHAYAITLINCTLNYSGTVNYQTCTCTGQYGCSGAAAKVTLTNSKINSNYAG